MNLLGIVRTWRRARRHFGQAPCFLTTTVLLFCSSFWTRGFFFTSIRVLPSDFQIWTLGPGLAGLRARLDPGLALRRFLGSVFISLLSAGCEMVLGSGGIRSGTGGRDSGITGSTTSRCHRRLAAIFGFSPTTYRSSDL